MTGPRRGDPDVNEGIIVTGGSLSAQNIVVGAGARQENVTGSPREEADREDDERPGAARVFVSYAREDETFRRELQKHLAVLEQERLVEVWTDRTLLAGDEWEQQLRRELERADVVLCLLSADFFASDYCSRFEIPWALECRERRGTRVIPIVVRPVDWQRTALGSLQAIPTDARPVSDWDDADRAYLEIVRALRKVLESGR